MFNGYKSHLSFTGLFIFIVALVMGTAFGGVAGYIVGRGLVLHSQPVTVRPVSNEMSLDLEPIPVINLPAAVPRPQLPSIVEGYSPAEAIDMALPAVVTVLTLDKLGRSNGSGFFISSEGHVVTNYHVVEDAEELVIIYAHGGLASATLVGTAPDFDLAVLKVDGAVPAVAQWGDSGEVLLGTNVIAIGSALGRYQNTVTAGVLSGFNRELGGLQALLQTDAAINQGNSGGPLINLAGQVIGINTLVLRGGFSEAEGLNFAISSNVARNVVEQLIDQGEVSPPFLGVQYQELREGVLLKDVLADTPATSAGLRAKDIIVAVDDRPVNERYPLMSLLLEHKPGETVTLEVLRKGETIRTSLTLGKKI